MADNSSILQFINVLHFAAISPFKDDILSGNVLPEDKDLLSVLPLVTQFIFTKPGTSQFGIDLNQQLAFALLEDINKNDKTKTLNDYGIDSKITLDKVNYILTSLANSEYWKDKDSKSNFKSKFEDKSLVNLGIDSKNNNNLDNNAGLGLNSLQDELEIADQRFSHNRRSQGRQRTHSSSSENSITDVDSDCDLPQVSRRYREVVQPSTYDIQSGQSLRKFLQKFERYFSRKYGGDAYEESMELEKFLKGDLLNVYYVNGGADTRYDRLKRELLSYYDSQKTHNHRYWKEELQRTSYSTGESLVVYAMRLKTIAAKAYPNIEEQEKELSHQFKKSVPRWFKTKMESQESITKTVLHRKLTWQERIELAKQEERKKKRENNNSLKDVQITFSGTSHTEERRSRSQERRNYRSPDYNRRPERQDRDRYFYSSQNPRRQSPASPNNSPAHRRERRESPTPSIKCTYCGRSNHNFDNCRLRQKQCLLCADKNHFFKDCPLNRNVTKPRDVISCPYCSGNHLGKYCKRNDNSNNNNNSLN